MRLLQGHQVRLEIGDRDFFLQVQSVLFLEQLEKSELLIDVVQHLNLAATLLPNKRLLVLHQLLLKLYDLVIYVPEEIVSLVLEVGQVHVELLVVLVDFFNQVVDHFLFLGRDRFFVVFL